MKAFAGTSGGMGAVAVVGAAVAAGVGLVGVMAAKSASEFQSSMLLIQTQAGASASEVKNMTGAVLALAPAVGTSPQKLADALFHIESVGLRGKAALDALKVAAEGAKVGHSDLEATTNVLLGTLTSGIGGVKDLHGAMGTLNAIVGAGNMRMGDLVGALSTGIMPAARTFGVSLQSIGAAIATMTNATTPADEAATRLRMTLSLMAAPTTKAQKDLASLGISHLQLAEDMRGPGGLHTALMDLKKHLEASGLSASQQAALLSHAFGGGRSSAGIMTLLGAVDRLGVAQEKIGKGAGAFGDAWKATTEETAFGTAQLGASLETIVDSIGLGLLPLLNKMFSVVNPLVSQVSAWAAANADMAAKILLVVGGVSALLGATIILGPVLGAIGTVIGVITSPIILVAGAVLGLAAHFGLLGDGAKSAFDGIAGTVAAAIPGIISTAEQIGNQIMTAIGNALPGILATLGQIGSQVLDWIVGQAPAWAAQLTVWGNAFVDWISPMIGQALAMLGQMAGQVIGWISAQAPGWAAQLVTWANAFVGWISPIVGTALGMLGQLAGQLLAWVSAQVPGWMAQLTKWAGAFVAWIGPMIPPLLAALGQAGSALVAWIAAEAPKVVGSLAQFALAFVRWVLPMIPPLLVALGQFAVAMVGWIAQQIPVLGGALLGMAAAFVGWIRPMIPQALGQLSNWLLQVLQWMGTVPGQLATAAGKFGASIFGGIMDGLKGLPAAVAGELSKIPGIGLIGDIGHNIAGAVGGAVGAPIPQGATGGAVVGTGLAVIHAGEQLIPPGGGGRGGAPTTHHTHIYLDGRQIAEALETVIFNNASGASSGFAGSSVTD